MTGAIRTTATDVMEQHVDLLPFPYLVEQHCHRAVVRTCTLPSTHPLYPLLVRARNRFVKRHRSTMHSLLYLFHLDIGSLETIKATRFRPTWTPGMKISIADTKDEAVERDEEATQRHNEVRVYTDGSDVDGGVGAAAVLYRRDKREKILKYHLGPSTEHTVYEAEIVGMILGTQLLLNEDTHIRQASIALDNQAAVRASRSRRPGAGHYLMDEFHRLKTKLKKKHEEIRLTIRWVPGHMDVEGNEKSDEEAKDAARGTSSSKNRLPAALHQSLPTSASRAKQNWKTHIKEQAQQRWVRSPRHRKMQQVAPNLSGKTFATLTDTLSRKQAALLFQLRTGNVGLNKHLYTITRADSPLCAACEEAPETVQHYLLYCPAYATARYRIFYEYGATALTLCALLNTKRLLRPLFKYIHDTRRFREQLGDVRLKAPATAGRRK